MRRRWLWIAAAIAVYCGVLLAVNRSAPGLHSTIAGLSQSADPEGSLALSRLWQRLGLGFTVWTEPPVQLSTANGGVFVSVEALPGQYSEKDASGLIQWIRAGHTAVWASDQANPVWNQLHIQSGMILPRTDNIQLAGSAPGLSAVTLYPVRIIQSGGVSLAGPGLRDAARLYKDAAGRVAGAEYRLGRGTLIVWGAPAVFENQNIGRGDNLRIAWTFFGNQLVVWDEYGHGVVGGSEWAITFGYGRQATLLFLFLAAVAFLWHGAVRFGRPLAHVDDKPRLGTEFLHALAWHLRQPSLRSYAHTLFVRAVHRRMRAMLGSNPSILEGRGLRQGHPLEASGREDQALWDALDQTVEQFRNPALSDAYRQWKEAWAYGRGRRFRKLWLERTARVYFALESTVQRTRQNSTDIQKGDG